MAKFLKYIAYMAPLFILCGLTTSEVSAQTSTTTTAATQSADQSLAEKSNEITKNIQEEIASILDDAGDRFRSLENKNLYGMGAGMLFGAVVADMLGGNGLVTIGTMVLGGIGGNWVAEEWF